MQTKRLADIAVHKPTRLHHSRQLSTLLVKKLKKVIYLNNTQTI